MNCNLKLIFSTVVGFCILSFASAAKPKQPEWMVKRAELYPESTFITGVGKGSSEEIAKGNALKEISQYFTTNVQTETVADSSMLQIQNGDVSSTSKVASIETSVRTSSETTLKGVSYAESFYDKKSKSWNSLAYIDRSVAYKVTLDETENIVRKFDSYFKNAKSLENRNPIKAIEAFKSAEESAMEMLVKVSLLKVIQPSNPNNSKYDADKKNAVSIGNLISRCKQNCTVFIKMSDDYNNQVYTVLANKLKKVNFIVAKTQESAVYLAKADLEYNTVKNGDIFDSRPSFSFTVMSDEDSLYSYSTDISIKSASYTEDGSRKSATSKLVADIEANFEL